MSLSGLNLKEFGKVIEQIANDKAISKEKVVETVEAAIGAAYKKEYGKKGEIIRAALDFDKNEIGFKQIKIVVDKEMVRIVDETEKETEEEPRLIKSVKDIVEEVEEREEDEEGEKKLRYNPNRHIFLEEAVEIKKDAQIDDEIEFPLETHEDFGRIAAQTAKQVIIQKLREAERESIFDEYKSKENELVSGIIQNYERGNVYVNLGKTTGIMFGNESIPTEHYASGQRYRFYILAVQEEGRLPGIVLSRANPQFVEKLFELEVPEIGEGIIEVKTVAREPGSRTKIAVASNDENIDPVGSCVGQRGSRVMAVINELGQEKVDIIPWSEDPSKFIANSLSPAKVKLVEILPKREVLVYVADDQLSLAIGKGGQNVRLAAKLTGWKIDVRSQADSEQSQASASPDDESQEPKAKKEKTKTKKAESETTDGKTEIIALQGIGPKAVASLQAAGYDSAEALQGISKEKLVAIEGIGEKTAEKIIESIQNL